MRVKWSASLYAMLIAVSTGLVLAFPQNDLSGTPAVGGVPANSNDLFRVDGFAFDGPADRQSSVRTDRPTRQTTFQTSTPSPVTTADPASANPQFNDCVTNCPITQEYNPVCGTDRTDYSNPGSLKCAAICGKSVSLNHYGRCASSQPRG